jgi:hypothetical protein
MASGLASFSGFGTLIDASSLDSARLSRVARIGQRLLQRSPVLRMWRGFIYRTGGALMRTAKKPKIMIPPTTADYQPDELETMRQAFIRACRENPALSATDDQRYELADALESVYHKDLTQSELIVAAVVKVKNKS